MDEKSDIGLGSNQPTGTIISAIVIVIADLAVGNCGELSAHRERHCGQRHECDDRPEHRRSGDDGLSTVDSRLHKTKVFSDQAGSDDK
ncbi:hypothetical protein BS630_16895 [Rhizobium laguerreae]|nr:hypothetical protein BS630_16895 [Rhizobium laguerreae]